MSQLNVFQRFSIKTDRYEGVTSVKVATSEPYAHRVRVSKRESKRESKRVSKRESNVCH